mmetsp:Transcript_7660/g.28840  ORF Transcript_7660/g.28840 Transcript_7660/m.28840 type:complete len:333 (-) Transcript_7660:122-1120(-)
MLAARRVAFCSLRAAQLRCNAPLSSTRQSLLRHGAAVQCLSTAGKKDVKDTSEAGIADHSWRQQNHIWTDAEIKQCIASRDQHHAPVSFSDHVMKNIMGGLYHAFNFVTWYQPNDPTPSSIEWRLIILESIAGVPGFIAAAFRHFYSLRSLQRDHGFIYTFLEEAENERMHLLVCLKMFDASWMTRALVISAQIVMTPVLITTYFIKPTAMHRFVGYLEETAIGTYSNIVEKAETPGTKLHTAWNELPAPDIAKSYWNLSRDATWVTCLKHMLADEAHHRDVNHTIASLPKGAENPFIKEHMEDFDAAAKRRVDALLKAAAVEEEQAKNKAA